MKKIAAAAVFAGYCLCFSGVAQAVSLKVDVGQSVGGTVTPQSGYQPFLANTSAPVSMSYPAPFGTGGGGSDVTLQITSPFYRSTPSGGYTQVTAPVGFEALLSGSALMNSTAQTIDVQLDDLADGRYALTTFHHANFSTSTGAATVDLLLTDANQTGALKHDDVPVTAGPDGTGFTTRVTKFDVVGGSTTNLRIDAGGGTAGPEHANLNALILTDITSGLPSLDVDFGASDNEGGGPGGVQASFEPFEAQGSGPDTRTFASLLGETGTVDVTLDNACCYRDYAAATGDFAPQGALLADGPLLNAAGEVNLVLEGLADGLYEMTTYHHTTQFGPSERGPATPFDILVSDSQSVDRAAATGLIMSDNASSSLTTASFGFRVSGGVPVGIDFIRPDSIGGDDHFALSGFTLRTIPEPMTAGMLGMGLVVLVRRRRVAAVAVVGR